MYSVDLPWNNNLEKLTVSVIVLSVWNRLGLELLFNTP